MTLLVNEHYSHNMDIVFEKSQVMDEINFGQQTIDPVRRQC